MCVRNFESVGNRTLFCLKVIEIRQSLEISAKMSTIERPLKALPAECLCLIFASKRLHHIEAYLFPVERNPTRSVFIDSINSAPRLLGTPCLQEAPGDFGRNSWHGPSLFALLRDKRINVALGVCNFL